MSIKTDIKTFQSCPEIRGYIVRMYVAKLAGILTVIITSPILLFGLIVAGLHWLLDRIGGALFFPFNFLINWLEEYQAEQIKTAHSIISIEDIQKRNGVEDEDL